LPFLSIHFPLYVITCEQTYVFLSVGKEGLSDLLHSSGIFCMLIANEIYIYMPAIMQNAVPDLDEEC